MKQKSKTLFAFTIRKSLISSSEIAHRPESAHERTRALKKINSKYYNVIGQECFTRERKNRRSIEEETFLQFSKIRSTCDSLFSNESSHGETLNVSQSGSSFSRCRNRISSLSKADTKPSNDDVTPQRHLLALHLRTRVTASRRDEEKASRG